MSAKGKVHCTVFGRAVETRRIIERIKAVGGRVTAVCPADREIPVPGGTLPVFERVFTIRGNGMRIRDADISRYDVAMCPNPGNPVPDRDPEPDALDALREIYRLSSLTEAFVDEFLAVF